jgi:hypothetical protein
MTRGEAIEYYKGERDKFEKTRAIQWKFGIGLWTLIALGIALFTKGEIRIPFWLAVVLTYLFLFAHYLFARFTQIGLIAARTRSDNVLKSLNASNEEFVSPEVGRVDIRITANDNWWIFFQVLSTNVLLLIMLATIRYR